MDDGTTATDELLNSSDEKVALVRITDGRPEVLTILPGGTIGSGEPLTPNPLAYWAVPTSTDTRIGDLLVWRELAWQLTDRCGDHHYAWTEYTEWAMTWARDVGLDPAVTVERNQVWAARRLSSSELASLTGRSRERALEHGAVPAEGGR